MLFLYFLFTFGFLLVSCSMSCSAGVSQAPAARPVDSGGLWPGAMPCPQVCAPMQRESVHIYQEKAILWISESHSNFFYNSS